MSAPEGYHEAAAWYEQRHRADQDTIATLRAERTRLTGLLISHTTLTPADIHIRITPPDTHNAG